MRVLALGGAGDMGRTAVTTLVNSSSIQSITVADSNYALAEKFVHFAGSEKLSAVKIDVTEKHSLVDLISRHDLVMSAVGPYYRFGPMITEACIEAKKSCVDICDDWKPMLDVLAMDEIAKRSNITIIPGIGASPGLSNLLAALAASEFDEVDEIVTAWGSGQGIAGPVQPHHVSRRVLESESSGQKNAAIMHLLHECVGTIPTYRKREFVHITALSDADPLQFPGHPDIPAYHIGHPEPVTLPRTIKANSVSNVMFYDKSFIKLLTQVAGQIKSSELSIEEAALKFNKEAGALASHQETMKFPAPICVTVTGQKKGVKIKSALALTHIPYGQMAGSTGVPLAIAAVMLAEGRIGKKGVLAPEATIDPAYFLDQYARYCGKGLRMNDILLKKKVNL
ncbi:MAG TPA: saccharopine dehydrogenase NADP-binding domain-containing protein [Smithellaceae bacterium]|nr:saccharopine dehydrogenase NADP-binding domain-containing protein [Smithellaceae bacterium]